MRYEVLKARLAGTLAGPTLEAETVIGACDILAREILDGKYDRVLEMALGAGMDRGQGADSVMAQGADSVTAQGADSVMAQGADSVMARGADSVMVQSADSVTAQGADSVTAQGADVVMAQGADSVMAQGADSVTAQGADSVTAQGADSVIAQARRAARFLSRPCLEERLRWELPPSPEGVRRYPLGVLLHIGAGNMEGLPAYSVVEGLLAGNINLLKLPEHDNGISSFLLRRLVNIEPKLGPYLYVFRISSTDRAAMKRLTSLADGIAVWGGNEAVRGVRELAGPSVKLIEWGHKISFAYVTLKGVRGQGGGRQLRLLARHMLDTGQVLCSSCQGIYLETKDETELEEFSKYFLEILESEALLRPSADIGARARNTLRVQCSSLEAAAYGGKHVFSGTRTSVTLKNDPRPEVSLMYGNCWVKSLPKPDILPVLRDNSGYLQTVALICGEEEREMLAHLFWRAGAVRVCSAGDMSGLPEHGFQPHDGELPLRRYSKYVT